MLKRGVKNYEKISKSRLGKETNKLKPSKKNLKKEKSVRFKTRILKIKKVVDNLSPSKNEKIKKFKKLIKISERDVYKPLKISGAFSDNYVEYKSDSKKDKLIKKYLDKIRGYLRRVINDKKKRGEWKIPLIIRLILFLLKISVMLGIYIVNLIMLKL